MCLTLSNQLILRRLLDTRMSCLVDTWIFLRVWPLRHDVLTVVGMVVRHDAASPSGPKQLVKLRV